MLPARVLSPRTSRSMQASTPSRFPLAQAAATLTASSIWKPSGSERVIIRSIFRRSPRPPMAYRWMARRGEPIQSSAVQAMTHCSAARRRIRSRAAGAMIRWMVVKALIVSIIATRPVQHSPHPPSPRRRPASPSPSMRVRVMLTASSILSGSRLAQAITPSIYQPLGPLMASR